MKTRDPKRALVLWYSQTGHTRRIGMILQGIWKTQGLNVDSSDIRNFDNNLMGKYDLIAMGTPVYYCRIPENAELWLKKIPRIDGIPVASFVTFGGPGDGQNITASGILELLADKGGVPVGMDTFGNMSTFAPTWSIGNEKRILKYSHLPNKNTYAEAEKYAKSILNNVQKEISVELGPEISFECLLKYLPQAWFTKLLLRRHTIDANKCIGCGTCVDKCPVDAVHPNEYKVDTKRCIACFGCVNNCPAQAIDMEFMGKKVYGFNEFMKRNKIEIEVPEILEKSTTLRTDI
ncbi:4Fe-4S ferredoxin [Candidatus Magnetomorum sp. HK-1]|nr:4Fe-4S ferredoxin [Candidatus Magnetomorum sp. HK-1]